MEEEPGLTPGRKRRLGLPRFKKMLDNAVDKAIDSSDNEDRYPSDPNKLIQKAAGGIS